MENIIKYEIIYNIDICISNVAKFSRSKRSLYSSGWLLQLRGLRDSLHRLFLKQVMTSELCALSIPTILRGVTLISGWQAVPPVEARPPSQGPNIESSFNRLV